MYSKINKIGTYYYADDGKELARYLESAQYGKLLLFNEARLKFTIFSTKSQYMTFAERAYPDYAEDIKTLLGLYPGISYSEYFNE